MSSQKGLPAQARFFHRILLRKKKLSKKKKKRDRYTQGEMITFQVDSYVSVSRSNLGREEKKKKGVKMQKKKLPLRHPSE